MSNLYVQCKLSRNGSFDVSWIQKHLAVVGNVVEFKGEDGLWEVVEAYTNVVLPWEELNERGQDYKKTREASDI
jgi:hypothetical protein